MFVFEKRTDSNYIKINYDHYYEVYKARKQLGKIQFDDAKKRTYLNIPKHKMFDFLRKAFEESPWLKIKKFKKKNDSKEYHIDFIYWEYLINGYVLKILCHNHYDTNDYSKKSHGVYIIKDINCLEFLENILDINDIEIIN